MPLAWFVRSAPRRKAKYGWPLSSLVRWIPFTAEAFVAATCTRFCWEARLDNGQDQRPYLINAYEDGYGRLTIRLGGVVSVKKVTGPEVDKAGDSALPGLNHVLPFADIESSFARSENSGARDFATADREDATGVTVDLDFSSEACLPSPSTLRVRAWLGSRRSLCPGRPSPRNSAIMATSSLLRIWKSPGTFRKAPSLTYAARSRRSHR